MNIRIDDIQKIGIEITGNLEVKIEIDQEEIKIEVS